MLKTAWLMDTVGNQGAHTEIQAIKIATPQTVAVDPRQGDPGARRRRALARTSRWPRRTPAIRTLRFADGPDEVHKASLARAELARQASNRS